MQNAAYHRIFIGDTYDLTRLCDFLIKKDSEQLCQPGLKTRHLVITNTHVYYGQQDTVMMQLYSILRFMPNVHTLEFSHPFSARHSLSTLRQPNLLKLLTLPLDMYAEIPARVSKGLELEHLSLLISSRESQYDEATSSPPAMTIKSRTVTVGIATSYSENDKVKSEDITLLTSCHFGELQRLNLDFDDHSLDTDVALLFEPLVVRHPSLRHIQLASETRKLQTVLLPYTSALELLSISFEDGPHSSVLPIPALVKGAYLPLHLAFKVIVITPGPVKDLLELIAGIEGRHDGQRAVVTIGIWLTEPKWWMCQGRWGWGESNAINSTTGLPDLDATQDGGPETQAGDDGEHTISAEAQINLDSLWAHNSWTDGWGEGFMLGKGTAGGEATAMDEESGKGTGWGEEQMGGEIDIAGNERVVMRDLIAHVDQHRKRLSEVGVMLVFDFVDEKGNKIRMQSD